MTRRDLHLLVILVILAAILAACAPLSVRAPDPQCYIVGIHRDRNAHVDRITEQCGTERRTFRPLPTGRSE